MVLDDDTHIPEIKCLQQVLWKTLKISLGLLAASCLGVWKSQRNLWT